MEPYTREPIDGTMVGIPCAEVPMKVALEGINKQLNETDAILGRILCNIMGAPGWDDAVGKEPGSMQEQVGKIDAMAARVLGDSHRLEELLFGRG